MEGKTIRLLLTLFLSASLLSGCQKSSLASQKIESSSLSIPSQQESLADLGARQIADQMTKAEEKETLRYAYSTYSQKNTDGKEEEVTYEEYVNKKDHYVRVEYLTDTGFERSVYTKELGGFYCYAKDSRLDTEGWYRFADETDPSVYESRSAVVDYGESYSEELGYSDVAFTNLGMDTLEGSSCVKILISGKFSDMDEDFSYSYHFRNTIWVDSESMLPVQMDTLIDYGENPYMEQDCKDMLIQYQFGAKCPKDQGVPDQYQEISKEEYQERVNRNGN